MYNTYGYVYVCITRMYKWTYTNVFGRLKCFKQLRTQWSCLWLVINDLLASRLWRPEVCKYTYTIVGMDFSRSLEKKILAASFPECPVFRCKEFVDRPLSHFDLRTEHWRHSVRCLGHLIFLPQPQRCSHVLSRSQPCIYCRLSCA